MKLLFPPFCLHCGEALDRLTGRFCAACQEQFVLIEAGGRCARCFSPTGTCVLCREPDFYFRRVAAGFEYRGAPASLVQALKHQGMPHLARDGAAFLALQLICLGWVLPDCIVPMPQSFVRSFSRGYNQSLLLAQELGQILERPVVELLKQRGGELPQDTLERCQREALPEEVFAWRKPTDLNKKVVLLVDDVRTTGATLRRAGARLREGFPAALYAMTLCM